MQVRAPRPVTNKDGQIIATSPRLFAQFQRGAPPEWAFEKAVNTLNFRGLAEGEPITLRMGTFDSVIAQEQHGWSDDERLLVESELEKRSQDMLIRVEQPKLEAPWATYDNYRPHGQRTPAKVAEKNIQIAADVGVPLEEVIAYEKQNENHSLLIKAYEAAAREALAAEPTEELVEA